MTWQSLDSKHKKMFGAGLIRCDDPGKRDDIIRLIKQTFPYYTRIEIAHAVEACCAASEAPWPREEFWSCVKNKLEEQA